MLLTNRDAQRVLGFIHARWYKSVNPDPSFYTEDCCSEFLSLIDKGYDVKLLATEDGIKLCDYTRGTTVQRFYDFAMKSTLLKVDAVVEDNYIYVFWQGQKKAFIPYTPKRKVPAAKTVARVEDLLRQRSGTPSWAEIEFNWL